VAQLPAISPALTRMEAQAMRQKATARLQRQPGADGER
jgi:hypothetical protein